MKLTVISSAPHFFNDKGVFSYGPFVREMNLWMKYCQEVTVVAPIQYKEELSGIEAMYSQKVNILKVPSFNTLNALNTLIFLIISPVIVFQLLRGIWSADHLHFRCPCNLSVIGLLLQVFFPFKVKSTKYAGNWDPSSGQPWSYRFQQSILRNRVLTRNIKVLVYGEWPEEPEHIIPFISATYYDEDKVPFKERDFKQTLEFVFAASLVPGKRPLLTVQIVEALNQKGYPAILHMFGDGPLRLELEQYIKNHGLNDQIILYGNRDISELKHYYQRAHFNILPSKSEGWPKAVAEGMFFGCVPVTTDVSCVSWMLNKGGRGILIKPQLEKAVKSIINALECEDLSEMAQQAKIWSEAYTFDRLESDIQSILNTI